MGLQPLKLATHDGSLSGFDGTFTVEIRKRFREHRRYLGISHQQLADFMQVSWTTIRKWENGKTASCQCRSIKLIQRFLNGEFDAQLDAQYGDGKYTMPVDYQNIPLPDCAERFLKLYYLSIPRPDLRQNLIRMMSSAVNRAAESLASASGSAADFNS